MKGKDIPFEISDEAAIEMRRSEEFNSAAQTLTDFISALPLTRDQNEKLVQLMVDQVIAAERSAFMQGASMALGVVRDCR